MSGSSPPPLRMLLVEDDPADASLTSALYEATGRDRQALDWADSIESALERLATGRYAVVLLDGTLHGRSGLELLTRARAQGSAARFIVLTGDTTGAAETELIAAGADDYLVKGETTVPLLDRALRYAIGRFQVGEARRESEHRFQQLANAAPALLYVTGGHGQPAFFNQAWLEFRGVTDETLATWWNAIHPEDRTRLAEHFDRWHCRREAAEVEYRLRRYDGQYRWMRDTSRPCAWAGGVDEGFVGSLLDIHDRKHAEAALALARDEALASSRMKSQLLANLGHEIRTPMNGIIGMSGLLLDTPMTSEQRELAHAVQKSADALLTVFNDLLDFSQLEAGRVTGAAVEFDVRTLLEDAVWLAAGPAEDKALAILADVPPTLTGRVHGDAAKLRQVLMNLLGNAVKFTDRGEIVAAVVVREATETELQLRFEVRDTGAGIPPTELSQLFRPFVQLDASNTRRHGGTGLGLAICKQLVDLLGGEIGVTSQAGVGSTFWFELRLPRAAETEARLPGPLPLAGTPVWIVSASAALGRILYAELGAMGCVGRYFAELTEATAALKEALPVPMGIFVDQATGPALADLVTAARAAARGTAIRFVLVTSVGRIAETPSGREVAFDAVLSKPLRQVSLRQCALRVLSSVGRVTNFKAPGPAHRTWEARQWRLRVLVVDDNSVNQKLAVRHLQRLGHEGDAADHGAHALELLGLQQYDLILMDCQMPVLDGYETTRRIRSGQVVGANVRIPIVAVTALGVQHDRGRCLAAGMDEFLAKPLRIEELQAAIERLRPRLQTPEGSATGPIVLEQVQLDHLNSLQDEEAPDFLHDLIEVFLRETPERLHELAEAFAAEDADHLGRVAHTLKGACANFGARELQNVCSQIEQYAARADFESAEPLIAELEPAFRRLHQALKVQQRKLPA